jgi:hypothetical protein
LALDFPQPIDPATAFINMHGVYLKMAAELMILKLPEP